MSYITEETALAIETMLENGFPVIFINSLPECLCEKDNSRYTVISLEELPDYVAGLGVKEITVAPEEKLLRYLHYQNGNDMYYFVNESAKTYSGIITIDHTGACYAYNAWENILEEVRAVQKEEKTEISVVLEPRKSFILIFDEAQGKLDAPIVPSGEKISINDGWTRSICEAIKYPDFSMEKEISLPDNLEEELPEFGGFVKYVKHLELDEGKRVILEITDAAEGVEVFVNGISAGIQIVPHYYYDITRFLIKGENCIQIEVATTLERVVPDKRRYLDTDLPKPENKCGICGNVNLYFQTK